MNKNINQSKTLKIGILFLLFVLMTITFRYNIFSSGNERIGGHQTFNTFQSDSENLVLSRINHDKFYSGTTYGLGSFRDADNQRIYYLSNISNPFDKNIIYEEYVSQYGLQGHIFSFLNLKLHIPISLLNLLCCILLSIVLILMCYIICKKYNLVLGIVFYLTFLLSPWVIAFARNLYWVEFTWFLPALFGLILSTNYSRKKVFVPLIFLAILIKCLCGYEYISSIMLMTISFFVVDFFIEKDKQMKKQICITTMIVGLVCLMAFMTALCIHASLRGNGNIIDGIKSIYEQDIARRTLNIAGSEQFDSTVFGESIHATIFQTVKLYFHWDTNVILGISGNYFKLLVFLSFILSLLNIIKKGKNSHRDFIMFIMFLLVTLSWYILGKAHSYIHITLNYVLWYFGFIQICFYIILTNILKIINYICKHKVDKV